MKLLATLIRLLTVFRQWLDSNEPPATPAQVPPATGTPASDQLARTLTPIPNPNAPTRYHISLYLKDGSMLSRSRSSDEYCVRTDGYVYVKEKGKWVRLPDVIGMSFYRKVV